ncbi:MAG: NAD(P)H-hydrate dehydratase [Desulfobulbales bacterium]|jgi:ADP-dependent NAD(P)H-hydrate dehydratase / NAD(P)H-hydrate epimerase
MLLLAGAVPIDKLPLLIGEIEVDEQGVKIEGHDLAFNRGNEAMMAAACLICQEYGVENPVGLVAGDIGNREGSEKIYDYLAENLPKLNVRVLTLHYIMPDLKRNKKVLATIDTMKEKPILIADAGSMYVAKAGGDSHYYDVFTPDLGETAFLADDKADHPTFTRGFIFHMENNVPELIRRAYASNNAAPTMFVKGSVDYICHNSEILYTIDEPSVPTMEPIGGTGDLITGMISGLIHAGKSPVEACRIAGHVNRKAGELSQPTPATQIRDILKFIPAALEEVLALQG